MNDSSPTVEDCDRHTLRISDDKNGRIIYLFDYNNGPELNWKILANLRRKRNSDIIKHPYMLNYINEILVNLAWIYFGRITLYTIFLILLYSSIYSDLQTWQKGIFLVLGVFHFITIVGD